MRCVDHSYSFSLPQGIASEEQLFTTWKALWPTPRRIIHGFRSLHQLAWFINKYDQCRFGRRESWLVFLGLQLLALCSLDFYNHIPWSHPHPPWEWWYRQIPGHSLLDSNISLFLEKIILTVSEVLLTCSFPRHMSFSCKLLRKTPSGTPRRLTILRKHTWKDSMWVYFQGDSPSDLRWFFVPPLKETHMYIWYSPT